MRKQFSLDDIDDCTRLLLRVLFVFYLAIAGILGIVFSTIVVGIFVARFIAIFCLCHANDYVKHSAYQLGSQP